ncbi:hypothetical protein GQ55_7G291300 [Panicum hallii var. hallii]|uniref:Uncharacterized protein n=1 Tax=Panicum hallii var. hallii TaxID=1504633 RepID=A0A2T7D097_9POAL|nr:hypothetical protein GQ55_7G291300 [Panicum hallii var. hallii]
MMRTTGSAGPRRSSARAAAAVEEQHGCRQGRGGAVKPLRGCHRRRMDRSLAHCRQRTGHRAGRRREERAETPNEVEQLPPAKNSKRIDGLRRRIHLRYMRHCPFRFHQMRRHAK